MSIAPKELTSKEAEDTIRSLQAPEELKDVALSVVGNAQFMCIDTGWNHLSFSVDGGRTWVLVTFEGETNGTAAVICSEDGVELCLLAYSDTRRESLRYKGSKTGACRLISRLGSSDLASLGDFSLTVESREALERLRGSR